MSGLPLFPFAAEGEEEAAIDLALVHISSGVVFFLAIVIFFVTIFFFVFFVFAVFDLLVFFVFVGFFVPVAGVLVGAGAAVVRWLADGFVGGEVAFAGLLAGAYGFLWFGRGGVFEELGRDLQAVEHEAETAGIHVGRTDGGEGLRESDLYAAGIFDGKEGEVVVEFGRPGAAVKFLVVIAPGLALKSG